ncbi:hypothetical protein CNMCM5623_002482 [Aspergillus felis]|uniref:Uncharacterized protein n=1 Tax=Aspergillus felis TaxID=1287682 RepID=A0A8H6QTW8_9EURO|nr:hypothetical protein CNMCM5623_002482 [Aspergillus felis]KAF7179595.1 hypothetical protein CNMCM7691_008643 [Aspergillus felis]
MSRGSRVALEERKMRARAKRSASRSGIPVVRKGSPTVRRLRFPVLGAHTTTSTPRWSARLPLGYGSWRPKASKGYKRQETETGELSAAMRGERIREGWITYIGNTMSWSP